ncbi:MAG: DsbE family thiol:disulfide interchange protein, partial [Sphingomicrobium sp.]
MSRILRFAPLALLCIIILAFIWRLTLPAETIIRSAMIGKAVPRFQLPAAVPTKPPLKSDDLASGHPRLLNIFASWCV